MDEDFALRLAAEIGIDVEQVIREEAELVFLKGLFESSVSDKLIFKGGTALRLIYNSPRFSEDLDFSVIDKIDSDEFKRIITRIINSDTRFSVKDIASKYYTNIAQVRIKEPWRDIALSVKIEVSKRILEGSDTSYTNSLAKSPVTNISVMTRAYTLDRILEEKLRAVNDRKMPRDIFDIWYIYQTKRNPFDLKKFGYPKGKLRQELRKFLPKRYYPAIEELERLNA